MLRGKGEQVSLRPLHFTVVLICLLINILDGFDLMSIAFTATRIMGEWQLGPRVMGLIFGSGLAGMGLGSLLLASLADRFGRRPSILGGLILVTIGMLPVGFANGPSELTLLRLVTGLGIGLLLPSINSMVAEYAPRRWRSLAISLYLMGYPLGALLSSVLAAFLIARSDWRTVYIVGGSASLALIPVVLAFLPESLEFLVTLQPNDRARRRIRKISNRLGLPVPPEPQQALPVSVRASPWSPFAGGYASRTVSIAAGFLLSWFTQFFITNWLPTIVTRETTANGGSYAGMLLTSGGLIGTIGFGLLATQFDTTRLCVAYLAGSLVAAVVFACATLTAPILWVLSGLLGLLLYGGTVGLYSLAAQIFPLEVRAAGTGLALATGRAGAVLGLSCGGWLIGTGMPRAAYGTLLALPMLVAVPVVWSLRPGSVTRLSRFRHFG